MPSDKAIEQKAHSIVSEFGPRWWNEHARQFPNSKLSEAELRDDMARYCVRAALEDLTHLIADKEHAENDNAFNFEAAQSECGKRLVAEDRIETLTARLRSMCEAMELFVSARLVNENGEHAGWRISGKGSVNEAYERARAEIDAAKKDLDNGH